jgi:hypothetical protein
VAALRSTHLTSTTSLSEQTSTSALPYEEAKHQRSLQSRIESNLDAMLFTIEDYGQAQNLIRELCDLADYCQKLPQDLNVKDELKTSTIVEIQQLLKDQDALFTIESDSLKPERLVDTFVFFTTTKAISLIEELEKNDSDYFVFLQHIATHLIKLYQCYVIDAHKTHEQVQSILTSIETITDTLNIIQEFLFENRKWTAIININLQIIEKQNALHESYRLVSHLLNKQTRDTLEFHISVTLFHTYKKQFDAYYQLEDIRKAHQAYQSMPHHLEIAIAINNEQPTPNNTLKNALIAYQDKVKKEYQQLVEKFKVHPPEEKTLTLKPDLLLQPFYDGIIRNIFTHSKKMMEDKKVDQSLGILNYVNNFMTADLCTDIPYFTLEYRAHVCQIYLDTKQWEPAKMIANQILGLCSKTPSIPHQHFALKSLKKSLLGSISVNKPSALEIENIKKKIKKLDEEIQLAALNLPAEEKATLAPINHFLFPKLVRIIDQSVDETSIANPRTLSGFIISSINQISENIKSATLIESKNENYSAIETLCTTLLEGEDSYNEEADITLLNLYAQLYIKQFAFGHKAVALFYLNRHVEALNIVETHPDCMYAGYVKSLIEKSNPNGSPALAFDYAMRGIKAELNYHAHLDFTPNPIRDHAFIEVILDSFQSFLPNTHDLDLHILIWDAQQDRASGYAKNYLKKALFLSLTDKNPTEITAEIFFSMALFGDIEKRFAYLQLAQFVCLNLLNTSTALHPQKRRILHFMMAHYLWVESVTFLQAGILGSYNETLSLLKNILLTNAAETSTTHFSLLSPLDDALAFVQDNNKKGATRLIERLFATLAKGQYSAKDAEIIFEKIQSLSILLVKPEALPTDSIVGKKKSRPKKKKTPKKQSESKLMEDFPKQEDALILLKKEAEEKSQQIAAEKIKMEQLLKEHTQQSTVEKESKILDKQIRQIHTKSLRIKDQINTSNNRILNINTHPTHGQMAEKNAAEKAFDERQEKLEKLLTELKDSPTPEDFKPSPEDDPELLRSIERDAKEKDFYTNAISKIEEEKKQCFAKKVKAENKMQSLNKLIKESTPRLMDLPDQAALLAHQENYKKARINVLDQKKVIVEFEEKIHSLTNAIATSTHTVTSTKLTADDLRLRIQAQEAILIKQQQISLTVQQILAEKAKLKILFPTILKQGNIYSQTCDSYLTEIDISINAQQHYLTLLNQAAILSAAYLQVLLDTSRFLENFINTAEQLLEVNKRYSASIRKANEDRRSKALAPQEALNTALRIAENLDTHTPLSTLPSLMPKAPLINEIKNSHLRDIKQHALSNKIHALIAAIQVEIEKNPTSFESLELIKLIALIKQLKPAIELPEKTKIKAMLTKLENNGATIALLTGGIVRDILLGKAYHREKLKKGSLIQDVDIDIITDLSEEGIRRAFPEPLYTVNPSKLDGLFLIIDHSSTDRIHFSCQIKQSEFFLKEKFAADPLFYDANSRDIPPLYADKNGLIYTPLAISLLLFAIKKLQLTTPEAASYLEDPRRLLRALIFLAINPDFSPTDRFVHSIPLGRDLLLTEDKASTNVFSSAKILNIFLNDKVFSYCGKIRCNIFDRFVTEGVIDKLFPNLTRLPKKDIHAILSNEANNVEHIYISFFILLNKTQLLDYINKKASPKSPGFWSDFQCLIELLTKDQLLLKAYFEDHPNKAAAHLLRYKQSGRPLEAYKPSPSIAGLILRKIMELYPVELPRTFIGKPQNSGAILAALSTLSPTAASFSPSKDPALTTQSTTYSVEEDAKLTPRPHFLANITASSTNTVATPSLVTLARNQHGSFATPQDQSKNKTNGVLDEVQTVNTLTT